jgi:hypothetical protein
MIRIANAKRRRRTCDELTWPSPARIERLAAEIREGWSPATRARRAGQARRVQLMIVSAVDLFDRASADDR